MRTTGVATAPAAALPRFPLTTTNGNPARYGERIARWRAAFPELAARFWDGQRPRCLFCGRTGTLDAPWAPFTSFAPAAAGPGGVLRVNLQLCTRPGTRTHHRVVRYGAASLNTRALEGGPVAAELWAAWCTECPPLDTPEGAAAHARAIDERAAGAAGWKSSAANTAPAVLVGAS